MNSMSDQQDSPEHNYIICPNCEMPYNTTLKRCQSCSYRVDEDQKE